MYNGRILSRTKFCYVNAHGRTWENKRDLFFFPDISMQDGEDQLDRSCEK